MIGTLYIIPCELGDSEWTNVIPAQVASTATDLRVFIVENERSARRYLKRLGIKTRIEDLKLLPIGKHVDDLQSDRYIDYLLNGHDVGLISEAGMPCVADPGAKIVSAAHSNNVKVVPLVGPSSILLALMASGLNGQSFEFHGYLPINKKERIKKIKELERSAARDTTQIFMEAPYRNQQLLSDILNSCLPDTMLCIATDITLATEQISTKPVGKWSKKVPMINKRPTVFLIGKPT